MEIRLNEGERLEPLGKKYSIVVSDEHIFGTDAVLLSSFCRVKEKTKACELGTGCGIISVLWCKNGCRDVTAVEIQKKACEQLEKTVALNGLEEQLTLLHGDLRQLRGVLPMGSFELVCMNPPYKPVGTGIESASEADRIARHETVCNIDDVTAAAAYLLKYGGRLCLCHRPERLCDVIVSMRNAGIEPKRLRFVVQQEGKKPWLFLIEGRLGSGRGITVENELVIKKPDGSNTDELCEIFGDYTEGH